MRLPEVVPPQYWMHETSGILRPVIAAYLNGEQLDAADCAIMRAYLRQWMAGDWRGPAIAGLRAEVDGLTTHQVIRDWVERALAQDIDPL